MEITQIPVSKAEVLIRRPVDHVFEAFIDPAITSKFWFTKGSGRLDAGKRIRWDWEMFGVSAEVIVKAIEANKRILIEWSTSGGNLTTVEWLFAPRADNTTFVTITESGFNGTGDEVVKKAIDSQGGFTFVLCRLKVFLEHNIALNLSVDHTPVQHKTELIQHLSKEIETHTNSLTDFRAKTSFTLLVGPFIVLGSFLVLAKTLEVKFHPNKINIALLFMLGICFMAIGFACSRIEKHVWDQNNRWRAEIMQLSQIPSRDYISNPPPPKHPILEFVGKLGSWWRVHRETDPWRYFSFRLFDSSTPSGPYKYNSNLFKGYFWFYFLILLTFACGAILFTRLEMPPSKVKESPPTSASTIEEQTR